MKKICLILAAAIAAQAFAGSASASYTPAGNGVLNISEVSADQVRVCSAVLLDSFEASDSERTGDEGTVVEENAQPAFESEHSLRLSGNGSAGVTLKLKKRRNTENTRSLAACVYAEPADGAALTLNMTLRGSKKEISASAELPQGVWCVAYLPIPGDAVNIDDVHISVSADRTARVVFLADWIHTALVDGMPEKLRYFASDYTASRGKLKETEDGLVFTPTGSGPYMESTQCGYMTGGVYNCLTVRLDNRTDASKLTLRLKLDGERSYSDVNTHTLPLTEGEGVYRFPIGGFRSGTTVEQIRFGLSGSPDGDLIFKEIYFDTYRFPAAYKGKASVEVTEQNVVVKGSLSDYPSASKRLCLYRLAPGADEEEPGGMDSGPYAELSASSSFEFTLPRTDAGEDNALYKYAVVYEGKNLAYTACVVSAVPETAKPATPPYKGADLPDDISALPSLYPAAVYIDVDMAELFADSGEESFAFGGTKRYLSSKELDRLDEAADRCREIGAEVILRLVYSPFSDSDRYYFTAGNDAVPDITSYAGASHFYSLVSFLTGRYKGKISAVVPCGALDSADMARMRGLSADGAEKYAAAVYRLALYAADKNGAGVLLPLTGDGADTFLGMLREDIPEGVITVYADCRSEESARAFISAAAGNSCLAAVRGDADTPERFVSLYYGSEGAAAICAAGADGETVCGLFALADTDAGEAEAERLAGGSFPGGVFSVYKRRTPSVRYADLKELPDSEPPHMVTTVVDGGSVDGWRVYDSCRNVFSDTADGETAAALSFDFSYGAHGSAVYDCSGASVSGERLYVRLVADYLPDGTDGISLKFTAVCENGRAEGVYRAEKEKTCAVMIPLPTYLGGLKKLAISPQDASGTPRICVLGVYTAGPGSDETLPEHETETLPAPETLNYETAPVTEAEKTQKDSGVRLYIIAICVITGMFVICGAVIFILKKADDLSRKKEKENETETGEEK